MVSPPLVYALLLLAVPLLTIILFSFWTQSFLTIDRTFTLANYSEALTDPLYRALMLRSLRIAGSVTAVTVILAFPIAYFISFHVRPERKALWIFLITIPFWTSYLIRIFLWRVLLAYDGPVNGTLTTVSAIAILAALAVLVALCVGLFWWLGQVRMPVAAGFAGLAGLLLLAWLLLPAGSALQAPFLDQPLSWILYNSNAVVITLAHAFAPFAILPIFVSLEKIDRSLLEAAQDLGEAKAMTFLRVTLPLTMPGVLAAVLIVFIPTVGDYVTPRLVGGSGGTMIANMIYVQIFDLSNRPMGATLAVLAMASVTVVLAWLILHIRFWVHLSDRVGGGIAGLALAGVAAAIDVAIIRWVFVEGPDWFGRAGSVGVLAAIMSGGAILIALLVPKGRWGI